MTTVLLVVAVLVAVLVLFVLIEVRKFRGLGQGGDLKGSSDLTKSIANDLELLRVAVDRSGRELREEVTGNMRGSITELGTHIEGSLGAVQKTLGEIGDLAGEVVSFRQLLAGTQTKGNWGEVQLRSILQDLLAPGQWAENVRTIPGSDERVEFAIKLPGIDGEGHVWLPVDAKFHQTDFQRLLDAKQAGDAREAKVHAKKLALKIATSAKEIREKYISSPYTTEIGILFLPTEGLYAEVLQYPKLADQLEELKIIPAGPVTLGALLSVIRVGFNTLAIEKRSGEVWKVLAAVKTEFGNFQGKVDDLKGQLETARNTVDGKGDSIERRLRMISKALKEVEQLRDDDSEEGDVDFDFDDIEDDEAA
jgi:DNA recombination protein RmuC